MLMTLLLQLVALTGFATAVVCAAGLFVEAMKEVRRGGSRPDRDNRMEVRS